MFCCFARSSSTSKSKAAPKRRATGRKKAAGAKKSGRSTQNRPAVKHVTQKTLKSKARSSRTKRVGATKDPKRRIGEYRREGATKNATVYVARSANMKYSENQLLTTCKKAKKCERNQQGKSNVPARPGYTYVIQKNK